jgi:hypothetical protein
MRRTLSALTGLVAAVAVLSAADATARSTPKIMVTSTTPVVVSGTGFRARETVRVVVRADESYAAKRATASATGELTMRFARVTLDRCGELVVTAKGDKGSRARVHRVPPACGIDPRPD